MSYKSAEILRSKFLFWSLSPKWLQYKLPQERLRGRLFIAR